MNVNDSPINNFASKAYGNTQALGANNTSTTTSPASPANTSSTNSTAEKVSISDTGRAAVAKDKNNFVNAIMKAGYTREQAEARFNKLQSQQVEAPATTTSATGTTTANNAVNATASTTTATSASNSTSSTTNNTETAAQNRFVQGFAKQGYSKEQAMNAYNLYANILNQGYMK